MVSFEILKETYSDASQWKGCDWVTAFGPRRLNLQGLRSRHAIVASKATRGEEAIAWYEAFRWLREVENDATTAGTLAQRAMRTLETNQFDAAIPWLRAAESLERRYPLPGLYRLLRERFEQFMEQQPEVGRGCEVDHNVASTTHCR